MPAPPLNKTWQFSVDNLVVATGVALAERQTCLWQIKQALIGAGSYTNAAGSGVALTTPMTVVSSSNGTSASVGTDLWTTPSSLAAGAWIVLQDAAINAKFQICIHLVSGWGFGNTAQFVSIFVSRLAGFGVANGGVVGTATTPPTATDQDTALNSILFQTNNTFTARWYLWRSSDGQCTRILFRNTSTGLWLNSWLWCKPKTDADAWPSAVVYRFGTNGSALTDPVAVGTVYTTYRNSTKVADLLCHGAIPANAQDTINVPNDFYSATTIDTYRLYLSSRTTAGAKGAIIGEVWDQRTGPSLLAQGSRIPSAGPYSWICLRDASQPPWILPWNNTVLKDTSTP
jgi:hypothetical protein